VAQGQNDPRVPASEAEQIVAAVRKNGKPVWYLLAKDEGHGFAKKRTATSTWPRPASSWRSSCSMPARPAPPLRSLPLVLAALAVLTLAVCGGRKTPVERLLSGIEEAVEDKDYDGVTAWLTADFRGGGLTRAMVADELRRYLLVFESIDLVMGDPQVEGEPAQKIQLRIAFTGRPIQRAGYDLRTETAVYDFTFDVIDEGGDLKIRGAVWAPAAPPAE
jgi:hypothetical protein